VSPFLQLSEQVEEHAAVGGMPEQNIVAPHDVCDAA
jgi:hypothetical protein